MVVIRLARGGSHNRPFFYVVVADKRARRDGRFIESLGFWNPSHPSKKGFSVNAARLQYWLSVGACLSTTVKNLVKNHANDTAGHEAVKGDASNQEVGS